MTTEQKIDEIYKTIVKGHPSSEELLKAAKKVVFIRFSSAEWEELSDAITDLANVIEEGRI